MSDEIVDLLLGKKTVIQPEIADRSTLEMYASCPHGANLYRKHGIYSNSEICEAGIAIHALIKEAYEFSGGDYEAMPDFFVNELPRQRPDIQPLIIEGAKYVADQLRFITPSAVMGVEKQIDYPRRELDGSVKNPPQWLVGRDGRPLVLTTAIDLLMAGKRNSLIVWDWKSGWKKRSNDEAYNSFQAQYIALLLWQIYPDVEVIEFLFQETRFGSYAKAIFIKNDEHPRQPGLTTQAAFMGRISTAADLWLTGCDDAWPIKEKCVNCDAIRHCKYANEYSVDLTTNPAEFVNRQAVLETLVERNDDLLKEYYKCHGAIQGSGIVYELRPSKPKFMPKIYETDSVEKPKKTRKKPDGQ